MQKQISKALIIPTLILWVLAGCNTSVATTSQATQPAATESPVIVEATATSEAAVTSTQEMQYEPVDASVCQTIQEQAAGALGIDFLMEENAPFLDELAGESGEGCRLIATGDGNTFANPTTVISTLTQSAGLGWSEQIDYQADGPTGSATGLVRYMALMLISVNWEPAEGTNCPSDQPISSCNLTPEQQLYTVEIDIAQYKATFSLDGHWEDSTTGFTLNLGQEWKNIYGGHEVVAQGGNKIDSLEDSITGKIQGDGADIQFKSSFTDSTGTARIWVIDANTITWSIVTAPDGEYYLPQQAIMIRK